MMGTSSSGEEESLSDPLSDIEQLGGEETSSEDSPIEMISRSTMGWPINLLKSLPPILKAEVLIEDMMNATQA